MLAVFYRLPRDTPDVPARTLDGIQYFSVKVTPQAFPENAVWLNMTGSRVQSSFVNFDFKSLIAAK